MEWKQINNYESYLVSSDGRVKSIDRICGKRKGIVKGKIMNGGLTKGYCSVVLHNVVSKKGMYVHRLVAQAFIPNPNNLPQVNHKNGIKTDNRVENLEWISISDNHLHSYKYLNRTRPDNSGMNNPNRKLTPKQVAFIKEKYLSGKMDSLQLAKKFNINRNYVYLLAKNKTWKQSWKTA